MFTTPITDKHDEIQDHIKKHGDGVKAIALWVDDAKKAWEETTSRGAESYFSPKIEKDDDGEVVKSAIKVYGDTIHVFVERKNYNGTFLPGFQKWDSYHNPPDCGLKYIDHMVANVGWGEMNIWEDFYSNILNCSMNFYSKPFNSLYIFELVAIISIFFLGKR